MESLIFTIAVFFMIYLCYSVFRADKLGQSEKILGIFSFKIKKDVLSKSGFKNK